MNIYECSKHTNKINWYLFLAKGGMAACTLSALGNYYALYSVGFKFFTFFKASSATLITLFFSAFTKNIKYNQQTIAKSIDLNHDGMNVKITKINGKMSKWPVKSLSVLTGNQFKKAMEGSGENKNQMSVHFHNKFLTLTIYSPMEPDLIMDIIFVEKEVIDCMEDEKLELFNAVTNSTEIRTEEYEKRMGTHGAVGEANENLKNDIEGKIDFQDEIILEMEKDQKLKTD